MPADKAVHLTTILDNLGLHEAVGELKAAEASGSDNLDQPIGTVAEREPLSESQQQHLPQHAATNSVGPTIGGLAPESTGSGFGQIELDKQLGDNYAQWLPGPIDASSTINASVHDFNFENGPDNAGQMDGPTSDFTHTDTGDDDGDSNESLVDELSHRVGTMSIGPAGRTKLYGPSSIGNFDGLGSPGVQDQRQAHGPLLTSSWSSDGRQVPEGLQEHLTNLFFDWENETSDIVDKTMYNLAKAKADRGEDTAYYSEALRNAM